MLRASEPPGTGLAEYIYIYCPEILPDGLLPACDRDRPTNIFSGTDKRMVLMHGVEERAAVGEEVVFVGDDNSDLEPIMMFPTAIGIVAGRNSGSAVTIGSDWAMRSTRTGKWSGRKGRYPQRKRFGEAGLWSAADGWRGRTADTEKAYTLEDYRELVYILGWE